MDNRRPVTIFYQSGLTGLSLLNSWIRERGFESFPVRGFDDRRSLNSWNRRATDLCAAVWVNYPVESNRDIETIASFVNQVLDKPGHWLYAPRPNAYLPVKHPALVGMAPPIRLRSDRKAGRVMVNSIIKITAVFPAGVKHIARHLVSKSKFLRRLINAPGSGMTGQEGAAALKACIPDEVQGWSRQWQLWSPGEETLERDLIERVRFYFPCPRSIHVVLLNQCNLSCVMCPYHSARYSQHHRSEYFQNLKSMTEETFRKIAEYAGKHRIALQFGQIEEPLLHPRIFDFIRMAKTAGVVNMHITTNGTLLDREKAEQLSRSGVNSVMFSLDAAMPETYRRIRGRDLDAVEQNIKVFIPLAKENNISVKVSFILQADARQERDDFLEKWMGIGVDSVTFYVLTEHDVHTGAFIREERLYVHGDRYPCGSPWVQSVVFPEGEVSFCCKTLTDVGWKGVIAAGSLKDTSFEEIWLGKSYGKLRAALLKNDLGPGHVCTDCEIWSSTNYVWEYHESYTRTYNETMETFAFK